MLTPEDKVWVLGTLREFWETTMVPWMEKTFVTKGELKDELANAFEKYDLKMEERFHEVNECFDDMNRRFDIVDDRFMGIDRRLTRVESNILNLRSSLRDHRENTEFRLESHAHTIRQLKGVAEKPRKKYDDDL